MRLRAMKTGEKTKASNAPAFEWYNQLRGIPEVGTDEHPGIPSENVPKVYQAIAGRTRWGRKYGEIPWRLGLLNVVTR